MNFFQKQNFWAGFVAIAIFGPILWMVMDRDPPYERLSGEIMPAQPAPGDFVSVRWRIKVAKACPPNVPRNVTRRIVTKSGRYIDYEPVEGVFGAEGEPIRETITRTFQLPKNIEPGSAKYQSKACFACNPIQVLWPVCVDKPDIHFEIEMKP